MVFLNFIFGALRWGQFGTYDTYVAYVRYVVLAKTQIGSKKLYSENYVQNLDGCLPGMTREWQKFEAPLEQRKHVSTPFLCPPVHPAQIVVCTSTLKCGLTPSTTQVIGASMKDGAMIYQDYGTYLPITAPSRRRRAQRRHSVCIGYVM